jgi:hypothetical protein
MPLPGACDVCRMVEIGRVEPQSRRDMSDIPIMKIRSREKPPHRLEIPGADAETDSINQFIDWSTYSLTSLFVSDSLTR